MAFPVDRHGRPFTQIPMTLHDMDVVLDLLEEFALDDPQIDRLFGVMDEAYGKLEHAVSVGNIARGGSSREYRDGRPVGRRVKKEKMVRNPVKPPKTVVSNEEAAV